MMSTIAKPPKNSIELLDRLTAADLMTPNPISIRSEASVAEATALFTDKAISGAAVIDDSGRPIGVLSSSDLMIHDREQTRTLSPAVDDDYRATRSAAPDSGYSVVDVDRTTVSSVMTPIVFSITPESSARRVMQELVSLRVHRIFVIDSSNVLVGVISALDVVKALLNACDAD